VAGQHRTTQRRPVPAGVDAELRLRARLRALARAHPRWGWRMAWRVLRREPGQPWTGVNHKRVRRLWREEGLRRPVRAGKRRRVAPGQAERLRAERPNQVWAIDFQFDETSDGRRLKLANIVDEHTREALAMRVARTCSADDLVEVLAGLVAGRGAPEHLRMDNGPELIAWALRDYCRLSATRTTYIEPGAPWENPFIESFNGRVRDELLNLEEFTSLTVAQVVVEAWRIEYNTYRPHSALGGLTPADYAANWTSTTHPALS
jgi:putative transposase